MKEPHPEGAHGRCPQGPTARYLETKRGPPSVSIHWGPNGPQESKDEAFSFPKVPVAQPLRLAPCKFFIQWGHMLEHRTRREVGAKGGDIAVLLFEHRPPCQSSGASPPTPRSTHCPQHLEEGSSTLPQGYDALGEWRSGPGRRRQCDAAHSAPLKIGIQPKHNIGCRAARRARAPPPTVGAASSSTTPSSLRKPCLPPVGPWNFGGNPRG